MDEEIGNGHLLLTTMIFLNIVMLYCMHTIGDMKAEQLSYSNAFRGLLDRCDGAAAQPLHKLRHTCTVGSTEQRMSSSCALITKCLWFVWGSNLYVGAATCGRTTQTEPKGTHILVVLEGVLPLDTNVHSTFFQPRDSSCVAKSHIHHEILVVFAVKPSLYSSVEGLLATGGVSFVCDLLAIAPL